MKIMSRESWCGGCADRAVAMTISRGMNAFPRAPRGARASQLTLQGDPSMTWQTPAATDLRFGFEITMYVSAR
jgi:coenzyme PQQ precursor peptide PqqA